MFLIILVLRELLTSCSGPCVTVTSHLSAVQNALDSVLLDSAYVPIAMIRRTNVIITLAVSVVVIPQDVTP